MTEADVRLMFQRRPHVMATMPRRSLSAQLRRQILAKTAGRCHVCGGDAGFGWQADHVIPHQHGGSCTADNALAICVECNRLRWSYQPDVLRAIIRLGVYAKREIRHDTPLGRQLVTLMAKRSQASSRRRVRRGAKPCAA